MHETDASRPAARYPNAVDPQWSAHSPATLAAEQGSCDLGWVRAEMTSEERVSSLLSLFWTPIVAVGATDGTTPNAQISVSTFGASVVPDRPRLLCILYKANHTHDLVARSESFSLSVLNQEQVDLTDLAPAGLFDGARGAHPGAPGEGRGEAP